MENLEQDPEELPMDVVLSEIRRILTAQTENPQKVENIEPVYSKEIISKEMLTECFLLTPAMRCDLPSDAELSQTVQRQANKVLSKLQNPPGDPSSDSAVIAWLKANLPQMIEDVMNKKRPEA